jgi:hypothetical protein
MAGRLGHIDGARRVGHVPVNGIRQTNYAYGFGGLVYRLWAEVGTSTKTDGGSIVTWESLLQPLIFQQTTAAQQPVFRLTDSNFNNYPSVDFLSGAPWMELIKGSIGVPKDFTIYIVYRNNAIGNGRNHIFASGNTTAESSFLVTGGNYSVILGLGFCRSTGTNGSDTYWGTTVEDTLPHIGILTFNDACVDGIEYNYVGRNYPNDNNLPWNKLGVGATLNGRNPNCRIADIGIFNTTFNQEQRLRLCENINQKYAIY